MARIGATSVVKAPLQLLQRTDRVVGFLRGLERGAIDELRLHVGAHQLHGARHQRLDRVGDVVRLVEHVGGRRMPPHPVRSASTSSLKIRNSWNGLIDPASRSSSPYLLSLKWKPPSFPNWIEPRDDHLDVDVRRVVAEIDEREARSPKLPGAVVARAPVVQHRRVEGRLVELVLDEQPPAVGQRRVDRRAGCRGSARARGGSAPARGSCRRRRSTPCAPRRRSRAASARHSRLCSMACRRTAGSVWLRLPNLYESGCPGWSWKVFEFMASTYSPRAAR